MSIFKITIKGGTPAVYNPTPLKAHVNDSAFWFNGDNKAHWPTPDAAKPKAWLDFQIPPNEQSSQIALDPPAPYTLNYVCSLHPGEKGQIKVVGKKKGAYGGKTKKGAFGGKTKKGAFGGKTKKGAFAKVTKQGVFAKIAEKPALAKVTKQGAFAKVAKKGAFAKKTNPGKSK